MNTKYLLIVFVMLVALALAYSSQSTLSPERGADHVFYGPSLEGGAFIGEEIAVGDFDGDGFQDFVSATKWDNPETGGAPEEVWETEDACEKAWGTVLVARGVDTLRVCDFAGAYGALHRTEWWELGWDSLDAGDCEDCYGEVLSPSLRDELCVECNAINLKGENQGAVYVFKGGTSWSAKPHDTDLTITAPGGANTIIFGDVPGGDIYGGIASGDVDNDGDDELAMGAPGAGNGAVYVIAGASTWPNAIDLGDTGDIVAHVGHYLIGRDANDLFGTGLAMGRLDPANNLYDIAVVAREGDGPDGDPRTECGEVYLFFGTSLPDTLSLSGMSDTALSGSSHVAVIYGPSEYSFLGNTFLYTCHPIHTTYAGPHPGGESPTGLAIGDWDGDGRDDLAISAGQAGGVDTFGRRPGDGAVYVIFGRPTGAANKLKPGNIIDLANAPDLNDVHAPDVRIVGKPGSALGAGIAFLDADGQGEAAVGSGGDAKDDLIMGAPEAFNGWGEVYIIFGDARETLTGSGFDDRDMANSADFDKRIRGEGFSSEYCTGAPDSLSFGDQLGSHFSGNLDFDNDGYYEVGISGQEENYIFFVTSQNDWPDVTYLETVNADYPDLRIVEFVGNQASSSNTIRFLNLDSDDGGDLVFGGYDADNRSGAIHSGEMWVWKGQEIWKEGVIDVSTSWSGNVFLHGDIVVEDGATLTIEAGTDVWIWPKDPDSSDDVWPSYPLHFDTTRVEFRVYGNLVVDGAPGDTVNIQAWTMDGRVSNEPDLWWGIHVHDGSATFDYCRIRNARHALSANTPLTITNSTIEHAEIIGLDVAGTDSVYADNLTIRDIGYTGIKINGMRVRLSDSNLSELADYGVDAFNGAKLYVDNTTIRDADVEAISIEDEDTYASIVDCTFENNYGGLRAWDEAVAVVEGSTIDASDNYGIYSLDDATIGVEGCTVTNAVSGIAIVESNGTLIGNLLQNCDVGLYSEGSAPTVEGCDISYNYIGVLGNQGGLPMMGYGGGYGYNEIHHSTLYHVSNLTTADTLRAESNHWKITTPPCFPLSTKINGRVDYIPALCSPPSPVSSQPATPTVIPVAYGLSLNYPNPFNPVTTVPFAVPSPGGKVTIAIFNVRGQLVRTLVNGTKQPGHHTVVWDGMNNHGSTLASGIYFLHMGAPGFQQTRKLALLK